jgi:hypothetical protein
VGVALSGVGPVGGVNGILDLVSWKIVLKEQSESHDLQMISAYQECSKGCSGAFT